jgi:hypothetical protein
MVLVTPRRFDIQSLVVVLPLVLIVALGIAFSAFSLSYNSYHSAADGFEVKAWWDGDHADVIVVAHPEAKLPAQVKVLEKVDDVYRPSKHLMLEVTLEEASSSHLLSAVTVSTEFKVMIFTSEDETVFDVQL